MSAVVDFRVDIDVGQSGSHQPNVFLPRVELLRLPKQVLSHHPQQAEIGVHGPSCLASEGLDSGDVSPQNEVVNVVGPFVSFYRLEVCHVAHDWVFVEDAVGPMNIS